MKNNTMNNRGTFVILNIVTAVMAACSAYGFCISNAKGNHWVLFVMLLAFAADTSKILDKKAEKICANYGLNMVIENTDNIPSYMTRVYKDLNNEDFRFCYDIGHDYLSKYIVRNLLDEISLPFDEFHIHDAKDRKKCHLALGEGELDIAKFKRLAEINEAYVVLEVKQSSDLLSSVPLFKKL